MTLQLRDCRGLILGVQKLARELIKQREQYPWLKTLVPKVQPLPGEIWQIFVYAFHLH